ncbi:MAG: flagellar biosynthetic protein FliR [Myxococcales bacterium]|nr:flagellar biosynthetic protein FliR [Myxococcales bacterium]
MPSPVVSAIADALARSGVDLGALGLAWARVTPSIVLVPAFGLRALPGPARAVLGLAFAASIFPAVAPLPVAGTPAAAAPASGVLWPALLASEALRGLPVAIAASVPLWAATMAGGIADALRGSQETPSAPTVEGRATPLGVPLSLLASAIFLVSGGPARVAAALASREPLAGPVLAAAQDLVGGVTLAVALGAPLLAAAVVIELAGALVARAASPAQVHALLAPVRAAATLAVMGLVFERMAAVIARAIAASP